MKNFLKKSEPDSPQKKSSFNFLTSNTDNGEVEVAASPTKSETNTAVSTPAKKSSSSKALSSSPSSKFSFKKPSFAGSKKSSSAAVVVPPSSPEPRSVTSDSSAAGQSKKKSSSFKKPSFASKKSSKKAAAAAQAATYDNEEPTPTKSSKKNKAAEAKPKRSCCSCKSLLCLSCISIIGIIIGVLVWRYGPWAADSATEIESFKTTATCNGCCNGLQSNCAKPVNKVLFPMVQNAHSSTANNFVTPSNTKSMEEALVAGFRGISLSTCNCELSFMTNSFLSKQEDWGLKDSQLGFCSGACGLGVRDPPPLLANIRTFMEENKNEILIIQIDMGEGTSSDFRKALQYSGLLEMVYTPAEAYYIAEWPTMQELINSNKRVILFGSGDEMGSCPANACLDGILYVNDHIVETATDSDLTECDATISGDVLVAFKKMNHYQDSKFGVPSVKDAVELNSFSQLENRYATCAGKREPNLLAVQFWDTGDVLEYVTNVNKGDQEFLLATGEVGEEEVENDKGNTYEGPQRRGLLRGW